MAQPYIDSPLRVTSTEQHDDCYTGVDFPYSSSSLYQTLQRSHQRPVFQRHNIRYGARVTCAKSQPIRLQAMHGAVVMTTTGLDASSHFCCRPDFIMLLQLFMLLLPQGEGCHQWQSFHYFVACCWRTVSFDNNPDMAFKCLHNTV